MARAWRVMLTRMLRRYRDPPVSPTVYERLGRRIARLRRELGLSGERLAERAGIAAAYLSRVESGKRAASVEVLARIAAALDVPLARLFEEPSAEDRDTMAQLLQAAERLSDEDVRALADLARRLRRA